MRTANRLCPVMISLLLAVGSLAGNASVWYVRAKGTGDGETASKPIGSWNALEALTSPGDIIMVLPALGPVDGGVALKPGQTLMGLADGRGKPSITNTDTNRNGGVGVLLADDCKILNLRIEHTQASAVLGVDVSGTLIHAVDVEDANESTNFTSVAAKVLDRIPHGGILFLATKPARQVENRIHGCWVTNAAGLGIGAVALNGARNRLVVSHTTADKGSPIPPLFDMGILALADGRSSEVRLEVADISLGGRVGEQGRNILAFASAEASASARIERSTLRECGQDGICAVAAMAPATVELEIWNCTIERAGEMNIEGTILNLPPSNPARADESLVSITVTDSIVRAAGAAGPFRADAHNIWLAPTSFAPGPFAKGRYALSVRNSRVTGAHRSGIEIGNDGREFKIPPDEGEYEVTLRDSTIMDNGSSEIAIAAAGARIDARHNWWGVASGLATNRVRLIESAQPSQFDASQPLSHETGGKQSQR